MVDIKVVNYGDLLNSFLNYFCFDSNNFCFWFNFFFSFVMLFFITLVWFAQKQYFFFRVVYNFFFFRNSRFNFFRFCRIILDNEVRDFFRVLIDFFKVLRFVCMVVWSCSNCLVVIRVVVFVFIFVVMSFIVSFFNSRVRVNDIGFFLYLVFFLNWL